jgi:hypothetical protein
VEAWNADRPVHVQTLARSDRFLRQMLNAIDAREPRWEETLTDSDYVFLCGVIMVHIWTAGKELRKLPILTRMDLGGRLESAN